MGRDASPEPGISPESHCMFRLTILQLTGYGNLMLVAYVARLLSTLGWDVPLYSHTQDTALLPSSYSFVLP